MDNDSSISMKAAWISFKGCKGSTLTVAARIEPVVISKIPFQFPRINTYRTMSENAAFYSYTPGSAWATLSLGEMLGYVEEREPFFKEYVVPGSGHPPGYVYGWVMNDDENLYVALDFTPDNTVDGELDYAKVYVLTVDGLKEFKVTQSEQTWGRANFTYTDKVNYEHKFYEFVIPLKEIGIADAVFPGAKRRRSGSPLLPMGQQLLPEKAGNGPRLTTPERTTTFVSTAIPVMDGSRFQFSGN